MNQFSNRLLEQSEQRTCDLKLLLFRYGGVHNWYDTKSGLKRQLVLTGRVDDPYQSPSGNFDEFSPGSAFHEKPVRLEISSPPNEKRLADVMGSLGVDNAFGVVWVEAHVEAKQFELDGEMVKAEPVRVSVEMSPDALERIRCQAAEANEKRRILLAKLTLLGNSLPEPDNSLGYIDLKDLDVSKRSSYAIGGFEIFDTRYVDDSRGRVLRVESGRGEGYGAYVSVLLTDARYEISAERANPYSIYCAGRVTSAWGKPYDGVDVTIEFTEHEPHRRDEPPPRRAFFGEFGYYPKLPQEKYASTHFTFHLRYLPEDARSLLIPLLSQEVGTRVILRVNLTNEEEELLSATEGLQGNVRQYSFEVQRRLVEYGAILERLEQARARLDQHNLENEARFPSAQSASEYQFEHIRRLLLAGGRVPDRELCFLSIEQVDALIDELSQ